MTTRRTRQHSMSRVWKREGANILPEAWCPQFGHSSRRKVLAALMLNLQNPEVALGSHGKDKAGNFAADLAEMAGPLELSSTISRHV